MLHPARTSSSFTLPKKKLKELIRDDGFSFCRLTSTVVRGSQEELAQRAIQWSCLRYPDNDGYDGMYTFSASVFVSANIHIFIHDGTQVSAFQPPIANRASMHACTCQLVGTELSVSSITTSSLNGYTNCTSEYRFARSSLSRCISIRNGQREVSLDAPSPAAEAAL